MIEREKATIIELRANHSFAIDRLRETKDAELAAAESKHASALSETNAKYAADNESSCVWIKSAERRVHSSSLR